MRSRSPSGTASTGACPPTTRRPSPSWIASEAAGCASSSSRGRRSGGSTTMRASHITWLGTTAGSSRTTGCRYGWTVPSVRGPPDTGRMALKAARWSCTPYSTAAAERLAAELGVSRELATILVRRGYGSADSARAHLVAEERHGPRAFRGMEAACELILGHVERGSRIVVHGDYDVDGVCSTAILIRALRALGAEPAWHIPA